MIGSDQTGPHLFQTCPSGNYYEYRAQAIGARSQSAKTYLEKHFENLSAYRLTNFFTVSRRLRVPLAKKISMEICWAHVGPDGNFKMLSKEEVVAVLASAGLSGTMMSSAASEDVAMEEA